MPTSMTTAPGFTQSPWIISRRAHRGHQHVGLAADARQVARAGVGDGHRGVRREEELRHGLAHDVAAADDHGARALERRARLGEEAHAAARRAGDEARTAQGEQARVERGEAVDVLARVDGVEHALLVDVPGEGELDEDAVDGASALSEATRAERARPRRSPRAGVERPRMPTSFDAFSLLRV